jgi:hypothetical protein
MNPLLETVGQIAAIVICLFTLVFIILAVAFNLAMAFAMGWLSEKVNAIKMLRPTVDSVNKATESALQGVSPAENEQGVLHAVASIPVTVHGLEKKVDQSTEKVANTVAEFRARTVQAKTVLKAFFLPGLTQKRQEVSVQEASLELKKSDTQMFVKEGPADIPVESPADQDHTEQMPPTEQIQHAAIH